MPFDAIFHLASSEPTQSLSAFVISTHIVAPSVSVNCVAQRSEAAVCNLTIFQKPKEDPPLATVWFYTMLHLSKTQLATSGRFPRQKISGLDSKRRDAAGLKRYEPCPHGTEPSKPANLVKQR